MAPEQTSSKSVDQRLIFIRLGIVLYEWSTGVTLHCRYTVSVLLKQASEPLPRPASSSVAFRSSGKVLFKALAKKSEDRYQDAEEFAEALVRLGLGKWRGCGEAVNEAPKSRRILWWWRVDRSVVLALGWDGDLKVAKGRTSPVVKDTPL